MKTENEEGILREMIKTKFNGEYATEICPDCSEFKAHPEGDTDTCPIVLCTECKAKRFDAIEKKST